MQWRVALFTALFLIVVVSCHAQSATGILTGKVFATTKGGDTKPARMAHVFLASGDDQVAVQQSLDKALTNRLESLKNNSDAEQACQLASVSVFAAVRASSTIQTVNTDEDGSFALPGLRPGTYLVIVIGTANGYQSVWRLSTDVTAGKRRKITLSEPVLECPS